MKRQLLTILLMPMLALGQEATKPDWISASDLIQKFSDTQDSSYLSNLSYRCSALYEIWGAMLTRDGAEIGEKYTNDSYTLILVGYGLSETKRGVDFAQLDEAAKLEGLLTIQKGAMYQSMITNYANWFTYSYVNFGEYTGDDGIKDELQSCQLLLGMMK